MYAEAIQSITKSDLEYVSAEPINFFLFEGQLM